MVTGSIAAAEIEAHSDHIVGKHKVAMPNWKHKVAGAAKLWVKSHSAGQSPTPCPWFGLKFPAQAVECVKAV
jgi:hypothetical protein